MTFEFLDVIEYETNEYIDLLPVDDGDEASKVIILKVVDAPNESEETYVSEEDPNILNAVYHIFRDKFKNEFLYSSAY